MTENYDCETCGRHLRDCLRAQQNDNDGYPCCPECEHFRERPIITTECPSVSPRAARQAWGASQPARLPPHKFVPRLNWMGGPALAFRDFCEVCDEQLVGDVQAISEDYTGLRAENAALATSVAKWADAASQAESALMCKSIDYDALRNENVKLRRVLRDHCIVRQVDTDGREHDWSCLNCGDGPDGAQTEAEIVHDPTCALAATEEEPTK